MAETIVNKVRVKFSFWNLEQRFSHSNNDIVAICSSMLMQISP